MRKLQQLTEKANAALRTLQQELIRAYPLGAIVRAKIHGRDVWIEAEVIGHAVPEDPHCLRVRNIRTGKARLVIARPGGGHHVELIRKP